MASPRMLCRSPLHLLLTGGSAYGSCLSRFHPYAVSPLSICATNVTSTAPGAPASNARRMAARSARSCCNAASRIRAGVAQLGFSVLRCAGDMFGAVSGFGWAVGAGLDI